ncbi:MAG: Coq4 family protein, partial [Dolichospermum sp.]
MIISELIDPNVRVQKFLNLLDTITENKGLNVQQIVKIEQLRSLPLGTFGRKWADFLDDNNIQPFTTGIRRKQLHDGVHILTGYGIDSIGEAEVQAFLLGSKFTIANLILGLVFLRKIHHNLSMQNSQKQLAWKRIKT